MAVIENPSNLGYRVCNCMYGTQDPRCCINKAKQAEIQRAWEAGRAGAPCPKPAGSRPIGADKWQTSVPAPRKGDPEPWILGEN